MEARTSPVLIIDSGFSDLEMKVVSRSETIGAYLCKKNGTDFENFGLACHRDIQNPADKVTNLISAYNGDAQGSDTFWSYITSSEGPFRDLFKIPGWKIYKVNGKIKAFSPPDEAMAFQPYALMYNFLVCTRMPAEFPHHTETFEYLVNRNFCPHLSFLIALMLDKDEGGFAVRDYLNWNGMHLPINDSECSRPFDFRMFKEGRYHPKVSYFTRTSEVWKGKGIFSRQQMRSFFLIGYTKEVKSGFATIKVISEDLIPRVMADFEKFMERRS